MKKRSFKRKSARTPIHRPGRNGKLGQRIRGRARRIKDGEFYPTPNKLKALARRALAERGRLEHAAFFANHPVREEELTGMHPSWRRPTTRIEEHDALRVFKGVPEFVALLKGLKAEAA